jgi:hypothetical protein
MDLPSAAVDLACTWRPAPILTRDDRAGARLGDHVLLVNGHDRRTVEPAGISPDMPFAGDDPRWLMRGRYLR